MTDTEPKGAAARCDALDSEARIRRALEDEAASQNRELAEVLAGVIRVWLEDDD